MVEVLEVHVVTTVAVRPADIIQVAAAQAGIQDLVVTVVTVQQLIMAMLFLATLVVVAEVAVDARVAKSVALADDLVPPVVV
jgi:hypothetical protein